MTIKGLNQLFRFERFFEKTGEENCWLWQGGKSTKGYGRFDGEQAHRFSYKNYVCKEIPVNKQVLHNCHTKSCVNPKHLYIGTGQDNIDFAWKTGECKLGKNHKLTYKDILEIREIWRTADIVDPRRNRRSPTQQEIADHYGVTQAAISAILSGKNGKGIVKGRSGFTKEDLTCQSAEQ